MSNNKRLEAVKTMRPCNQLLEPVQGRGSLLTRLATAGVSRLQKVLWRLSISLRRGKVFGSTAPRAFLSSMAMEFLDRSDRAAEELRI